MSAARVCSLLLLAALLSSPGCALTTALGDGEEDQAPGEDMGAGLTEMATISDMPVEPPATIFDTLDGCERSGCEERSGTCVLQQGSQGSSCLGPAQLHERCTISQKIEPALPDATALSTLMPDGSVVMLVQGSAEQKHLIRFTDERASRTQASNSNFVAHMIAPDTAGTLNVLVTQGGGLSLSRINVDDGSSMGAIKLTFNMPDSPAIQLCSGAAQPLFAVPYRSNNEQRLAAVFCDQSESGARWQLGGFRPDLQNQQLDRFYTAYGLVVPQGPTVQALFVLDSAQRPELAYLVNSAGAGRYKLDPYSFNADQSGMGPESVAGVATNRWAAYDLPPTGMSSAERCASSSFGAQPPRLWLPSGALKERVHIVAAGDKNYQILASALRNGPLGVQYCEDDGAQYTLRDAKYDPRMNRAALLFERLDTSATEPGIYVDMFGGAATHKKRVVLSPTASDNNLRAVAAIPLDNRVLVTGMRTHNGEQQVFVMRLSPDARPICRAE